jgi:farnesyl diphosphate synthase/geranylgeranyl diphosphate synthase type II
MKPGFFIFLSDRSEHIEAQLAQIEISNGNSEFASIETTLTSLASALTYSLTNRAKRIRPILAYGAAGAIGAESFELVDMVACAIELIHTYSLIHDDLPAMDDDDLRRGKPSLHKAYDEATAILVGDGLQARAFELLADAPGLSAEQRIKMVKVLAAAAGPRGMVGGQAIDIAAVDSDMDLKQLQTARP